MTEPNEKTRIEIPTREPKKKTPGIFDNLRKLPERHPVEEILGLAPTKEEQATDTNPTPSIPSTPSTHTTPSSATTPSTTSRPSRDSTNQSKKLGISPERDYTKVANSILRVAVPTGVFGEQGGKAKELYDYLYQQTRGGVVPRRRVRIPKDKLMRGAGIGSEVTLRKNLMRLRAAGLVIETIMPGTHGGNEYEVFMPEEVGLPETLTPSTGSTPSTASNTRQNREPLPPLDSRGSSPGTIEGESTTYGKDKTLSKDLSQKKKNDDDEAFADHISALKNAVRELTGREASPAEAGRWREVAEVLVTELKIAAARTTVSSVPAFLAEHLRRRLFKKDKRQIEHEASAGGESPTLGVMVDAKKCPDCGGSNYYYPDGYEKGVARCRHEKLRPNTE